MRSNSNNVNEGENKKSKPCMEERLENALENRRRISTLRSLELSNQKLPSLTTKATSDFSSNDYLGLAHSKSQLQKVNKAYHDYIESSNPPYLGSTGSRLLSGNSILATKLEQKLAKIHSPTLSTSALLFNSGYDANLSILSSIPMANDYILMDELVHNSLIMGVKMGRIPVDQVLSFQHNNVKDLEHKLVNLSHILDERNTIHNQGNNGHRGQIMIVVESVYSMDGDIAPLEQILDLALLYNANVVVDEAHGLGVFGKTNSSDLCCQSSTDDVVSISTNTNIVSSSTIGGTGVIAALNLENHPSLLAAVYTFGKAAGCHGAVVIAKEVVKQYLINYARPFVYSTSLPPHSLCTIECAYDTMIGEEGSKLRKRVFGLVRLFRQSILTEFGLNHNDDVHHQRNNNLLLNSSSPIQAIICRGNERCIYVSQLLRKLGPFDVFPIRSPTVPKGEERIRVIIHAHNHEKDILHLVKCLTASLKESSSERIPLIAKL
jgi:8-amino-7-oxononanoate synthase